MTNNQAFIVSSNSFTGRADENGKVSTFFSLLVLKNDSHDRVTASTQYVSADVFKQFLGSGIYDVNWNVYFDQKGQPHVKLSAIKLVKEINL